MAAPAAIRPPTIRSRCGRTRCLASAPLGSRRRAIGAVRGLASRAPRSRPSLVPRRGRARCPHRAAAPSARCVALPPAAPRPRPSLVPRCGMVPRLAAGESNRTPRPARLWGAHGDAPRKTLSVCYSPCPRAIFAPLVPHFAALLTPPLRRAPHAPSPLHCLWLCLPPPPRHRKNGTNAPDFPGSFRT